MKTKAAAAVLGLAVAAAAVFALARTRQPNAVVSVDDVAVHPERFAGAVAVAGTVTEVDSAGGAFVLGCHDACLRLPVRFAGPMPAVGRDVIVRGQVKPSAQGRYVFDAQQVVAK
jgi:hypothetical protein